MSSPSSADVALSFLVSALCSAVLLHSAAGNVLFMSLYLDLLLRLGQQVHLSDGILVCLALCSCCFDERHVLHDPSVSLCAYCKTKGGLSHCFFETYSCFSYELLSYTCTVSNACFCCSVSRRPLGSS